MNHIINTEAHHAAWETPEGWFVSCCWGRGRIYPHEQVREILTDLEQEKPEGCCAHLWRRISERVNAPKV